MAEGDRLTLRRSTAGSGLRVLVAPLPHLHTATIAAFVKVGSRHETASDNGISHFLEHMVFRGSRLHPSSYALNLAIEDLGGALDGETHADMTVFHASVPPAHAGRAADVLADMLIRPTFADLEIERRIVREEMLADLDEDGTDVNADNAARRLVFAPHPLGFPIPGTLENVARFDVDALRAHHAARYVQCNVVVVATGAVEPERVAQEIAEAFDGMPAGKPTEDASLDAVGERERFLWVDDPGSQCHLRVSFPTFGERDPRAAALHVLARVLDDGLSSRVPRRICDETGLAYDAFGSLETWSDAGALDFGASVAPERAGDAVSAFAELCAELREQGPDRVELDRVKRRWAFQLEAQADDGPSTAFFHGTAATLGLTDLGTEAAIARARAVTLHEVREVAREILTPQNLHTACIGDRTAARRARHALDRHALEGRT